MKKTSMKTIPYPNITSYKDVENKYIGIVERKIVDHKLTLVIHVFEKIEGEFKPFLQQFCTKKDFTTLFEDGKVSVKCMADIISIFHIDFVQGENLIKEYLKLYFEKNSVNTDHLNSYNLIYSYQQSLKKMLYKKRNLQKYRKEKEKISPDIKIFRKINNINYGKKIRHIAFKDVAFLFYDKNEKTGYCNVCRESFTLTQNYKQNEVTVCPSCKKEVIAKSLSYGRGKLNYVRWSLKVENRNGCILIRYFRHTWDLSKDYKNNEIISKEMIRSIFRENKTHVDFSYEYNKFTEKYEWMHYKEAHGVMGNTPSEYLRPRNIYLYNSISDLQKIIKDSNYKYSGLPEFLSGYMEEHNLKAPYIIEHYLYTWLKKPYVEKFAKVGFSNLIVNLMNRFYSTFKIEKEGTLPEMLGVSREHLKWLMEKKNPISTDVYILKNNPKITKKDFFTLVNSPNYGNQYDAYLECKKYTSLYKINKYLKEQNQEGNVRLYRDYLSMSADLGYNMRSTFVLYPKLLVQRHDERAKEIKAQEEKIERERLEAYNKELKKFMELNKEAIKNNAYTDVQTSKFLKIGEFFIRLPYNTDEIKKEGEALHHCVGSYVSRVLDGKTEIYFIRKCCEPEKPFYTVEWKDHEIKQCYGMKNCKATPEVKAFADTFSKLMNQDTLVA